MRDTSNNNYNYFPTTCNTNFTDFNTSNYQNTQDFYDIQAEQESLQLLKTQNKKIKTLYDELNSKESLIAKLTSQLEQYNQNSIDLENSRDQYSNKEKILKEQINLLENKVKSLEEDNQSKDQINTDNIEKFQKREEDLLTELNNKENEVISRNEALEYLEAVNSELKQKISSIEMSLKNKESDVFEANNKLKSLNIKYNNVNENLENASKDFKATVNQLNSEKESLQLKINQLSNLIQNQSKDLSTKTEEIQYAQQDYKKMKEENIKLKREIDSLVVKIEDLKLTIEKLKQLQENLIFQENNNRELKDLLSEERHKNSSYSDKIASLETETFKLKELIEGKELSSNDIYKKNIELESKMHTYRSRISKLELEAEAKYTDEVNLTEDLRLFVEIITKDLALGLKYADTYIGNLYFNKENKLMIPEIQSNTFLFNKSSFKNQVFYEYIRNLNLQQLFDMFSKLQKKINQELIYYEENYLIINQELNETQEKNKSIIMENTGLKNKIIELEEKIQNITYLKNSLQEEINELEEKNIIVLKEAEKRTKDGLVVYEEIEEDIISIISNLDSIKNTVKNNNTINSLIRNDYFDENTFKNFIDFDDLKEIYRINYHNHNYLFHGTNNTNSNYNNKSNNNNKSNEYNNSLKYDIEKFKENVICFFGVFKSLSEEYVKCIKKLVEMSSIKGEVELIKSEFNNSKKQMINENEELVRKNEELQRQLEVVFKENLQKMHISFTEKEKQMKEDIRKKTIYVDNVSKEIDFLKKQLESSEKRIRVICDNKKDIETNLSRIIEEKESMISNYENEINKLKLDYQSIFIRLRDNEYLNEKLNRQVKILNSNAVNSVNTSVFK